ncbi:MAG: DNA polymerase III subunit delta [Gammaproteobacteria bacterium]
MAYKTTSCPVLQFARDMQQGKKPPPSSVIIGDETHLINEARTAIEQAAAASETARIDFAELGDNPSAGGASLFGGTTLQNIIGYSSSFRLGKPPEDAFNALIKIIARPPDGDIVIAAFYGFDDKKMKGKLAWLHELQNKHKAKVIRAMQCGESATAQWCKFWLPSMNDDAANDIGAQTTGNFGAAKQAMMKMALYGGTTAKDAKAALSDGGRYGIFELTDKAVLHDGRGALKILAHLLAANQPAPLILWAISDAAWKLMALKRGAPVFGAWGDRLSAMKKIANYESERNIMEVIRKAARADRIIKGAEYKNTEDKGATIKIALTNLIVDLASLGRKARIPLPGRAITGDD